MSLSQRSSLAVVFVSEEHYDQVSFEEFLHSRSHLDSNRYELIDGRIVMNPPTSWPYGEAELDVAAILRAHVKDKNVGMAGGSSLGYELPNGHTVAPDASVVLHERLRSGPPREKKKFLRVVPNLVAEVISPTSEARDRTTKKRVYAAAGIDEYWLVDVDRKLVTVYHLLPDGVYDPGEEFHSGDKVCSRVLSHLDCRVDELIPEYTADE